MICAQVGTSPCCLWLCQKVIVCVCMCVCTRVCVCVCMGGALPMQLGRPGWY